METALLIFQLLYTSPQPEQFVAPHNIVNDTGSQGLGLTADFVPVVTPMAIKEGQIPAPPVVSEPQGVRPEPTGCYWGDSIPLEACDKFKP